MSKVSGLLLSFSLFVAAYGFVFALLRLRCYSTLCLQTQQTQLRTTWAVAGGYFAMCALFLYAFPHLPIRIKSFLQSEIYIIRKLRIKYEISNRMLFRITWLDFIHTAILATLLVFDFKYYFDAMYSSISHRVALHPIPGWKPDAAWWRSTFVSAGHWCDVLIGLNLIPLSRHSFIAKVLGLSTGASIRYHQFTGNLLVLAVLWHGVIGYNVFLSKSSESFWSETFLLGTFGNGYTDYCIPFGIAAFLGLLMIRASSLPIIRRRAYRLFLTLHYTFVIPFLTFASLHAVSNFYWTFPALALYILDLIFRLYHYHKTLPARAINETPDIVRLDVKVGKRHVEPGQFFTLYIPAVSKVFSHPFSVAGIKGDTVSFLIKRHPSEKWTSSVCEIAEDIDRVALDGPFCHSPFDFNKVSGIACVVAGSGIAAAFSLIQKASSSGKPSFLIWSIRHPYWLDLSFLQELCSLPKVYIQICYTGDPKELEGPKKLEKSRSDFYRFTMGRVESKSFEFITGDHIGLYICGPNQFMNHVQELTFSKPIFVTFRETFEL
ncbi:hypothetical protein HK103_007443 [Boothiomyces macroporosus]|uniref:FAD-binding FR-type domain-containing protein n=1 Tax=Boothiomyces macroporosus TaxID=261099 RepID=A0AAD5UKW6_9FUNG|nr:hypothetical protein HK103_007443 [Boothiomyces macroporosus]